MATAALKRLKKRILKLGPECAGVSLTANEFDAADFEIGWRYELIKGVLVVSPAPKPQERSPNDVLGYWLRMYQENHRFGSSLNDTLPEHDIRVGDQRRRADRVIWARLGRQPRPEETPTIAVEFTSAGKRNMIRDYEEKRKEYAAIGVREYWVINRFRRNLTVFLQGGTKTVYDEKRIYKTKLLPGFRMSISKLLASAAKWK
jgi:Uma2 family endonuclease